MLEGAVPSEVSLTMWDHAAVKRLHHDDPRSPVALREGPVQAAWFSAVAWLLFATTALTFAVARVVYVYARDRIAGHGASWLVVVAAIGIVTAVEIWGSVHRWAPVHQGAAFAASIVANVLLLAWISAFWTAEAGLFMIAICTVLLLGLALFASVPCGGFSPWAAVMFVVSLALALALLLGVFAADGVPVWGDGPAWLAPAHRGADDRWQSVIAWLVATAVTLMGVRSMARSADRVDFTQWIFATWRAYLTVMIWCKLLSGFICKPQNNRCIRACCGPGDLGAPTF